MFVYFFLSFLFSQLCLSQTHSQLILSSSHLSVSPFLKTLSSSLSQTLTSLSHHHRPDSILNVTAHQSSMSPTHQSPHFVELPSRWSASDPRRRFIWVWSGFLVGLITVAFVNCGWSSGLLVGLIIVGFYFYFLLVVSGGSWWFWVLMVLWVMWVIMAHCQSVWVWFGFLVGLITVAFVNYGWFSGLLVGLIIVGLLFLIGYWWWIMVVLGFDSAVGDVN